MTKQEFAAKEFMKLARWATRREEWGDTQVPASDRFKAEEQEWYNGYVVAMGQVRDEARRRAKKLRAK